MANPASFLNVLNGTETTQPLLLNSACTFGGPAAPGVTVPVVVAAATATLTLTPALHANRLVLIQSTGGLVITPAPATGTGNVYAIVVIATVSGGSVTIDFKAANATDVINGTGTQFKVGTSTLSYSCGTNTNLVTLNGTTTGGIIGDFFSWADVATHQNIIVEFNTQATSTVATPFSNH